MKLREVREKSGKTQAEVAEYLNISRQGYNNYELGNREPSKENWLKLAKLFNVSVDYLMSDDDTPQQDEKSKSADDELAENVIIYHRNGGTVKKTFSKEDMELLTKMIEKLGQDDYDNI